MLLFTCSITMNSCMYYKVTAYNTPVVRQTDIVNMQKDLRYFIIHLGNKVWHLKNIRITSDRTGITGLLDSLPLSHARYLNSPNYGPTHFRAIKGDPTKDIQFYISGYLQGDSNQIIIPFNSIKRVDISSHAVGAEIAASVGLSVGIAAGTILAIGIIAIIAILG